jgi:hypothetical protein
MQQHTQPAGAHGSSSRLSSFWNFHLNNNASISRAGDSGEMRNDPRCERYIVWWFDSRGNNCPYCVMCVAVWWRMAIRQTSDIINNGPSKDLAPKATQSTCPARQRCTERSWRLKKADKFSCNQSFLLVIKIIISHYHCLSGRGLQWTRAQ